MEELKTKKDAPIKMTECDDMARPELVEEHTKTVTTYDSLISCLATTEDKPLKKRGRRRVSYGKVSSDDIKTNVEENSDILHSVTEDIRSNTSLFKTSSTFLRENFNDYPDQESKRIVLDPSKIVDGVEKSGKEFSNDRNGVLRNHIDSSRDGSPEQDSERIVLDSSQIPNEGGSIGNEYPHDGDGSEMEKIVLDSSQTYGRERSTDNACENKTNNLRSNELNSKSSDIEEKLEGSKSQIENKDSHKILDPVELSAQDENPKKQSSLSGGYAMSEDNVPMSDEQLPTHIQGNLEKSLPTDDELKNASGVLFASYNEDNVTTIGDIVRFLQEKFDTKLTKKKKKMIHSHLMATIDAENAAAKNESQDEKESVTEEEAPSSDDEEWEQTKKHRKKTKRSERKTKLKHTDNNRRKRKDEEKVASEEIEAAEQQQRQSKEDLERMEAIQKKFDTETEEILLQRKENRLDLLNKLKKKRMNIFHENNDSVDVVIKKEPDQKKVVSTSAEKDQSSADETDSDSNDDDDDGDDELEILPPPIKPARADPCALLFRKSPRRKSPKKKVDARLMLRNALKTKQMRASNQWLAKELGYKNEEEHILDCLMIEEKRKNKLEKEEVQKMMKGEESVAIVSDNMSYTEEKDEEDDELDEEILLARDIEAESTNNVEETLDTELTKDAKSLRDGVRPKEIDDVRANLPSETADKITVEDVTKRGHGEELDLDTENISEPYEVKNSSDTEQKSCVDAAVNEKRTPTASDNSESEAEKKLLESEDEDNTNVKLGTSETNSNNNETENKESNQEADKNTSNVSTEKKQRNAAFQAMLKKEALREKKRKKTGLVENEAEEDEEEEGLAGLEDFGFSFVQKKKEDEDEENEEVENEDLEDIVDELSDGEGDEEAGEAARKRMQQKEEKEKHKEFLRSVTDGFNGRRGDVTGGSARGRHGFDRITAAGNRDDAKRLGLLNDDELDSDNDEGEKEFDGEENVDEDVDDENVLLDRMLKERYLNKAVKPETFSDEEEDVQTTVNVEDDKVETEEEKAEREQVRLAQIFAKRARMNRLLEEYEGDAEFSQSRLIDEESISQDLKSIKCLYSSKRKREEQSAEASIQRQGSLSLSIGSRQRSLKKKKNNLFNRSESDERGSDRPVLSRSVTMSHVVFHNNSGNCSTAEGGGNPQSGDGGRLARSSSVGLHKSQSLPVRANEQPSGGSSSSSGGLASANGSAGTGLWSTVSRNRISKR